jgi:hypothetical protein
MSLRRRLPLPAASAMIALLACAACAQAADFNPRPHSDFTLRDKGVRIARFDVLARPRGDRVEIFVTVTARSRSAPMNAVLRIGRCTGGPPTLPICEPNASRAVRFSPRATTIIRMNATVPLPLARSDAIRISLTPPGRIVRPNVDAHKGDPQARIVDMLLPSSAWTGFVGGVFGVRIQRPWEGDLLPYDVRSIGARGAQLRTDDLRASLSWRVGPAAATTMTTTAGCSTPAAICNPFARPATTSATATTYFQARPTLHRTAAREVLRVGLDAARDTLLRLTLPWPR